MSNTAVHLEAVPDHHAAQSLNLLEGDVSPADAYEAVNALIASTKSYYATRNLSYQERFGKNDEWSELMLSRLDQRAPRLVSKINQARADGRQVRIETTIKVHVDSR